jgi:hypothetical protein
VVARQPFIPYTEAEVGANNRFESGFMVNYLAGNLSTGSY